MKKTNQQCYCSLRVSEKKLECFLDKKRLSERNRLRLIVLARLLTFLSIVLTYVRER